MFIEKSKQVLNLFTVGSVFDAKPLISNFTVDVLGVLLSLLLFVAHSPPLFAYILLFF